MPEEITANAQELLKVLRDNRKRHVAQFEEAYAAFCEQAIALMQRNLEEAKGGHGVTLTISLPVPENHAADYDREIRMLEMHQFAEIRIHSQLFDQIVMDRWRWSDVFAATNATYSGR